MPLLAVRTDPPGVREDRRALFPVGFAGYLFRVFVMAQSLQLGLAPMHVPVPWDDQEDSDMSPGRKRPGDAAGPPGKTKREGQNKAPAGGKGCIGLRRPRGSRGR